MRTRIVNGTVVNGCGSVKADVLVEADRIVALGPDAAQEADRILDAEGCLLFPGFIDTHTHFDLDLGVTVTADDFITGTKAAVLGGTTTVLDFCTQDRGMTMQQL